MSDVKKILLVGAGSFLGRAFLRTSENERESVYTISRHVVEAKVAGHFEGDVFDAHFFQEVLEEVKPSMILNFVGSADGSQGLEQLIHLNTGVLKLWDELTSKETKLTQKFIMMGSAAEYGKASENPLTEKTKCLPAGVYGEAKVVQTELAKKLNKTGDAQVYVVRPFNLMGAGSPSTLISEKIRLKLADLSEDEDLILDDPEMARDFIDVDDFSEALLALMMSESPGGIYNICRGEKVSLANLGAAYLEAAGKSGRVIQAEKPEFRSPVRNAIGSCDLLRTMTDWRPGRSLLQSAIRQSEERVK